MKENKNNSLKEGILASLLKTIDFLLKKLGYDKDSRIRKKLKPVILIITIILFGLIVIFFTGYSLNKVILAFIGIPILLVIGDWIVSTFNTKEKTKKKLGFFTIFIGIIIIGLIFTYKNRQKIYTVINEITTISNNTIKQEEKKQPKPIQYTDQKTTKPIESKPVTEKVSTEFIEITIGMPTKKVKEIFYGNKKAIITKSNTIQCVFKIPKGIYKLKIIHTDNSKVEIPEIEYSQSKILSL